MRKLPIYSFEVSLLEDPGSHGGGKLAETCTGQALVSFYSLGIARKLQMPTSCGLVTNISISG
jgi:hypothetical protein